MKIYSYESLISLNGVRVHIPSDATGTSSLDLYRHLPEIALERIEINRYHLFRHALSGEMNEAEDDENDVAVLLKVRALKK